MEPKILRERPLSFGNPPAGPRDRAAIEKIVVSSGKFNEGEIATAMELVNEAWKSEASGYFFAVLEEDDPKPSVHGYACYGPTPLTREFMISTGSWWTPRPRRRDTEGACWSTWKRT